MKISYVVNSAASRRKLELIKQTIEGPRGAAVIATVALWTYGELVRKTPKKWTGFTRRNWQIEKRGRGYRITNANKVMLFLEKGTRAHGPVTAKALFIPLTRKAALGGTNLVYGIDYILVKRVKGIRAKNIVRDQRVLTRARLLSEMKKLIGTVV